MAIHVACPHCNQKLKAKDELAGQRLKCPACGNQVLVPSFAAAETVMVEPGGLESLVAAIAAENIPALSRLFRQQDFTMISTDDSTEDGLVPMTAEVDDFPAFVAFTSEKFAEDFANAVPDMLNEEGNLPIFVISGREFLANMPDGFGVLLNPESPEVMVLPPDLVAQICSNRGPTDSGPSDFEENGDENSDARALRDAVLDYLGKRGFQAARWLPLSDIDRDVRPLNDIASRLMALGALFTYTAAPEEAVPAKVVLDNIKRNRLQDWITAEEAEVLSLPRDEARAIHGNTIGWRLENMWPLAWALGFEEEPTIEAAQIQSEITNAILFDFLGGPDVPLDEFIAKCKPRSTDEIVALEDRFYCAHNAVRSAQLGEDTVPEDFDPIVHGGAVHERRHSLTWCLSPGTAWDDTDLST